MDECKLLTWCRLLCSLIKDDAAPPVSQPAFKYAPSLCHRDSLPLCFTLHVNLCFPIPNYAGDGHHGSTGVMRERRAADDPYWSYSGELSFVLITAQQLEYLNVHLQKHYA
uniref:Uncharacterized protein n=1 Tax=Seriola dumerili TaxID=41447 RepID=A0A3B4V752_SERDU